MGIVGGGGNIAIATALPPIMVCVLDCKHQLAYGYSLYNFLWLPEASVSGRGDKPWGAASCRILCSNVRGLAGNLSDLTVASSQYDILLCSQICVTCRRCWFLVSVALSCCVRARCLGPVGWLYTFEMVTEHFANQNLSVVVAKCWFLVFAV